MKLTEAKKLIKSPKRDGFLVVFQRFVEPERLIFDYFPELDEPPIKTEKEAWELAQAFAEKTFDYCLDIYVCDENFTPVKDYKAKLIHNDRGRK